MHAKLYRPFQQHRHQYRYPLRQKSMSVLACIGWQPTCKAKLIRANSPPEATLFKGTGRVAFIRRHLELHLLQTMRGRRRRQQDDVKACALHGQMLHMLGCFFAQTARPPDDAWRRTWQLHGIRQDCAQPYFPKASKSAAACGFAGARQFRQLLRQLFRLNAVFARHAHQFAHTTFLCGQFIRIDIAATGQSRILALISPNSASILANIFRLSAKRGSMFCRLPSSFGIDRFDVGCRCLRLCCRPPARRFAATRPNAPDCRGFGLRFPIRWV